MKKEGLSATYVTKYPACETKESLETATVPAREDFIEENVIVDHKTGMKSIIRDNDGMYVYPMTITRKKKRDAMDIGIVEEEKTEIQLDIMEGKYTAANHLERGEMVDGIWTPF